MDNEEEDEDDEEEDDDDDDPDLVEDLDGCWWADDEIDGEIEFVLLLCSFISFVDDLDISAIALSLFLLFFRFLIYFLSLSIFLFLNPKNINYIDR